MRMEILELPEPVIPPGAPTACWVAKSDTSWKQGAPTFQIRDESRSVAEGRVAVSSSHILLLVVVHDAVHFNNCERGDIWGGDCLQIGIDARGDGSGGMPADTRMVGGPDDVALAAALARNGPEMWAYYLGDTVADGCALDYPCSIVRSEEQKTTTYDLAFPWEGLSTHAGQAPTLGMCVQVNDSSPQSDVQKRHYWGRGADGIPAPGLFERLAIGKPPAEILSSGPVSARLWRKGSCGEISLAVASDRELAIRCRVDGTEQVRRLGTLSFAGGLKRYVARFCPDTLPEKPVLMEAEIIDKVGKSLSRTEVQLEVPGAAIERLHARIDELRCSSPHSLFTRHLLSVDALAQSEWVRTLQMLDQTQCPVETVARNARKLLDSLNAEAGRWDTYLRAGRSLVFARSAKPDTTLQFYHLTLPAGWDPARTYPLVVFLHGRGSPDSMSSVADPREYDFDENSERTAGNGRQFFVLTPWGRGNSGYTEWSEDDVFQALDDVLWSFRVDRNRTYLAGFSMGGGGTWSIAVHSPDRWAAICPASGVLWNVPMDLGVVRNIARLPVRIWHGDKDGVVSLRNSSLMNEELRRYGNSPDFIVVPGHGHSYPYKAFMENMSWLLMHERQRPASFSFIADSDRWRGAWGIRMKRTVKVSATPHFDAVIDGNTITINSEGTNGLSIDSGPGGLALTGSYTVYWNGRKAYEGSEREVSLGEGGGTGP